METQPLHSPGRYLRWIPLILWMALIFMLSHHPGGESGKMTKEMLDMLASIGIDLRAWFGEGASQVLRKTAHVFVYTVLTLFFRLALPNARYWHYLLYALLFAYSDEFHQTLVPGRQGTVMDVIIDGVGVGIGIAIAGIYDQLWGQKRD